MKLRSLLSLATAAAVFLAVGCSSDTGTNPVANTDVSLDSDSGKATAPDAVRVDGGDASAKKKNKNDDGGLLGGLGDAVDDAVDDVIDEIDEATGDGGLLDRVDLQDVKKLKSELISAATGGKISVGEVSLDIPPGALNVDTEISVVLLYGANDEVDFELLPHGTTFNVPVTLEVNLNSMFSNHDDVRQFWLDETTGDWVDVGGTWSYPTMTTEIDHFSRWKTGRAGW